jgi:hypothetical protein
MEYLHQELNLNAGDVVEVTLDHAANVQLLDPVNFERYRQKQQYHYHGGYVTESPFSIVAPASGRWHLVIDLGGNAGQVRAWTKVLRGADLKVG